MNLKTILKSLVLGCLLAFAAIIMEFLFLFYEDDIIIEPNPICLFVLQLLLFSGIVLLLSLQFRMHAEDGTSKKKFSMGILLQLILLVLYFLNIVINSLLFYGLATVNAALLVISVAMYLLRRDKKYLLQAGVYLFLTCLYQLIPMTGYWIEA